MAKGRYFAVNLLIALLLVGCGMSSLQNTSETDNSAEPNTTTSISAVTELETLTEETTDRSSHAQDDISPVLAIDAAVTELESSSAADELPKKKKTPTKHKIDVKNIMQKPELPYGCEIVSLTIVLNHLGFDVDKMYMSDNYLKQVDYWDKDGERYGADPYKAFPGNPAELNSTGCFAPVIADSANRFFKDNNSSNIGIDTSGQTLTELFHTYIDNDVPVIIWITSSDLHEIVYKYSWKTEDGDTIRFPSYEHCVVMTGYDTKKKVVYVADPLVGNTSYDMQLLEKRFTELGSNSVIIEVK